MSRLLCSSHSVVTLFTDGVIQHGGDGSVLRRVHSIYFGGRSSELIKFKVGVSLFLKFTILVGVLIPFFIITVRTCGHGGTSCAC